MDSNNCLKITIKNINTNTSVSFVATPESLDDSYSANFNETNILGRSTPILMYTGGSKRDLSFAVVFHEDIIKEDLGKFIDNIRALSFPVYDHGVKVPRVYARIGGMYSFWGVLNTNVVYSPPFRDGRMICATVTFNFTRINYINGSSSLSGDIPISAFDFERHEVDRR